MNVDPLGLGATPEREFRKMFRDSVTETVTRSTPIVATGPVLTWGVPAGAWELNTATKTLKNGAETWALEEVVYVLADDNTAPAFVVLIFHIEARRAAVRVTPSTFSANLGQSRAWGAVLFSTIDSNRPVGRGKKPVIDAGFPNLALGFDSSALGARANTGLSGSTTHVVHRATGDKVLYCHRRRALDGVCCP